MGIATPPLELLLIEDSPSDVRLTTEVLREIAPAVQLTTASDGAEAMNLLADRRRQKQPVPDLILLDLNLPLMPGHEVLEKIKGTAGLRHVPIVVLTTSRAERDALRCYELGANALINKPVDLNGFVRTMTAFAAFWLEHAKLWRG
jgi:CheY-like chemotaxis protein